MVVTVEGGGAGHGGHSAGRGAGCRGCIVGRRAGRGGCGAGRRGHGMRRGAGHGSGRSAGCGHILVEAVGVILAITQPFQLNTPSIIQPSHKEMKERWVRAHAHVMGIPYSRPQGSDTQ